MYNTIVTKKDIFLNKRLNPKLVKIQSDLEATPNKLPYSNL